MNALCERILGLLSDTLIKKSKTDEGTVFYVKMKGDYYRYIAEFESGDRKTEVTNLAEQCYIESRKLCESKLESTNPIRLGHALNYSVFKYEICQDPEKACEIAKTAFDYAIADLDNVSDEYYKDSTLIMQLLRDNLTMWTNEIQEDDK